LTFFRSSDRREGEHSTKNLNEKKIIFHRLICKQIARSSDADGDGAAQSDARGRIGIPMSPDQCSEAESYGRVTGVELGVAGQY
jgi:hypothetical protein